MGILEKTQYILGHLQVPLRNFGRVAPYVIAGFVGYSAADLTLLVYRPNMLPTEAPPVRPQRSKMGKFIPVSGYAAIWDRNLFNEDGKMPPALSSDETDESPMGSQDAVLSELPIQLLGTIVHFNPNKSIATIQRSGQDIKPFIVGEDAFGMARITKVERRRVTFQNLNNRRLEYIEMPEDKLAMDFDVKKGNTGGAPIQQSARNEFVVQRDLVNRLTNNLSEVLQKAQMLPRYGKDGGVTGFCFVGIQPNSEYSELGFKVGDCIESVNGKAVRSPQEAFSLYNELKSAGNIQLGIERDGRSENFNYTIK